MHFSRKILLNFISLLSKYRTQSMSTFSRRSILYSNPLYVECVCRVYTVYTHPYDRINDNLNPISYCLIKKTDILSFVNRERPGCCLVSQPKRKEKRAEYEPLNDKNLNSGFTVMKIGYKNRLYDYFSFKVFYRLFLLLWMLGEFIRIMLCLCCVCLLARSCRILFEVNG